VVNWVDVGIVAVVGLFAVLAISRGFVQVMANLVGFVLTLLVAFLWHPAVAEWLTAQGGLAPLWARPLAFLGVWLGAQLVYSLFVRLALGNLMRRASRSSLNRSLAVIPGALHGVIISALVLTVLALAPVGNPSGTGTSVPRDLILSSQLGGRLVRTTLGVERQLAGIFEPALEATLGFLTVQPEPTSGETIELKFDVSDPAPDTEDEQRMLDLVNTERTTRNLPPLAMDATLRSLARSYALDLFARGYFSHTSKEGLSPFDRMRNAGVIYGLAGENLALAPTLDLAHDGLMQSPGHRANILNPGFHKAGIGVLDGGVYGKMFVQEFTD
jgi:uncharacterized protein YkwD/uncharacterized membrane protein required for colicin V production